MDLLLTPLVSKFLRQYVKRSAEGAGSDLKVSFSRGNVLTLHNLELNLAPLLGGAAALAHVQRAFARRLSITIPWTALTSQPIQVVLDTVELVLSAAEQSPAPTPVMSASTLHPSDSEAALSVGGEDEAAAAAAAAAAAGGGGSSGGSSWLGSTLQSMALRAGLNVTVQLSNVVLKWVQEGEFVAAATFQQLLLQTSTDDWREGRKNPEAWLKKELSIKQLSLSLDQHESRTALRTPAPTPRDSAATLLPLSPRAGAATGGQAAFGGGSAGAHTYQPVLRVSTVRASALLPAFAWLEGADLAGEPFNTSVEVQLSPLHVAVNDRQLRWAGHLAALMQAAAIAKRAASAAEAEAAAAAAAAAARLAAIAGPGAGAPGTPRRPGHVAAAAVGSTPASPPTRPSPTAAAAAAQGVARPQAKALGVFGRVWDFLVDEAAYLESAEGMSPTAASQQPGSPLAAAADEAGASPRQQGPPPSSPAAALQALPMHAELQVVLEQLHVALGVVADAAQLAAPAAAGAAAAGGQEGGGQQQEEPEPQLAMAPDLAATLEQLRAARASNSVEAAAALQQQLAAALSAAGAGASAGAQAAGSAAGQRLAHLPRYRVHQFAELHLGRLQVAVASMDTSISGVAVELHQLSLRRSAAAVQLLSRLLGLCGRSVSVSSAGHQALAAAAAAAASAGSGSWVDVLVLEADGQPPSPAAAAHLSPQQQARAQLAVSVHYYDQAARPGGSASTAGGPLTPGQLHCSAAVGRLLVAHAPGFLTHLALFAGQYSAAASVSTLSGGRLPGHSSSSLLLPGGSPAPSRATSPERPGHPGSSAAAAGCGAAEAEAAAGDAGAGGKPGLLAQALLPHVQLEWRIGQLEVVALSSEAPEASAVVLLLRQLELRSGALSWDAPWNNHLRHTLLAPPSGFGSHGLRLSLASATLGIADLPAGAVPGDGLWQLHQAAAISTAVQQDAVVCAEPANAAAAAEGSAGSSSSSGMQVAAVISPLQVHASSQQAAVLAQVAAAVSAELSAGFGAPLVVEQPGEQQAQRQPWLAKLSLSLATGVQVAYASSGGLQQWRDPRTASAVPQLPRSSGGSGCAAQGGPGFNVRLGSAVLAVALTPDTAAAGAPDPQLGRQGAHEHHPHLVLQAQLEEAQLALQPQFAVRLPVVEVRLGSAQDVAAPAMLAEPLLLASGLSYQRHGRTEEAAEQQQQQQQQQHQQHGQRRSFSGTAVRCASLALAVSAADYPLLLSMLRCVRQQPALPPRPALVACGGTEPAQEAQGQLLQGTQPQGVGSSQHVQPAAEQEQASELTVELDGACLTVWPQQQPAAQALAPHQPQQQQGLAVWLCRLRVHKQQTAAAGRGTSSSLQISLASAHAALVRHQQPAAGGGSSQGAPLEWSPVLTFPAAAAQPGGSGQQRQQQQQAQPGLTLTLCSSAQSGSVVGSSPRYGFSPSKGPPAGQRLQVQAAPVCLALSADLFAATGAISAGISGTASAAAADGAQRDADQPLSESSALEAAEAAALQGKAALQGVRLVLAEAACWTDQWPAGVQQRPHSAPVAAPAVALDIEEAVLLLQRTPAAENRPWLAGGGTRAAGSLLTAVDASLIGAAITVHHAGPPGADATPLLPPTDGSAQVLLQPHADAVSVALNAQLLPLQMSVPAVSSIASVVSALFSSEEDEQRQQQQQLAPPAARVPAPSAAAVAAAATVIIEDAAATLQPHGRSASLGAAPGQLAPAAQQQPAMQQPGDDLAAALFTLVHSSGPSSRPAPLQVHTFGGGAVGARGGTGEGAGLGARLWAAASGGSERQEAQQALDAAPAQRLHGIRWCYPQPREVALLAVEHAPGELLAATFQLSWYCEEAGEYLVVPLQALMHDRLGSDSTSGGSGKTLLLVAGEAVAAAEWQLRWELPPGSAAPAAQAAAVLHRLRINPRCGSAAEASAAALRRQVWLPPPLAASLTVVLTAESGSLSLLAPAPLPLLHGQGGTAAPSKQQQPPQQQPGGMQQQAARGSSAPPVALLDAVAVLHLGGLKAALHSYPSPEDSSLLAGDLQAQLALCLPDSSSAVAPAGTLLAAAAPGAAVVQPFLLDCAVEYSSCSDAFHLQQPAAAEQLGQQQQAAEAGSTGGGSSGNAQGSAPQLPFWQAQAAHQPGELPLLAVRPPPAGRGLGVALAAQQQPVVVNASEAALAEVRHLVAALSAGPADNSSSGLSPAAPTAPLLLINRSGMALRVRQEGNPAQGHLLLQDGQRQSLLWPAPPALVPGAVRRLQLAPAAAAEGDESAWSAPVDVMASGGHAVLLPAPGRGSSAGRCLAAQVQPDSSGGWEVVLRPGMRLVNHLSSPVHFCLTRDGWGGSDDGSAAAAPAQQRSPQRRRREQHTPVVVGSGGSTDVRLPTEGAMLRLWLGGGASGTPGSGWSQAVSLPQQRQQPAAALMVLHSSPAAAATATAAGLDTPPDAAGQPPLGSVLAQLLPPDASGQTSLQLWPPLLLHNSTPCALRLLLPAGGPQQPGAAQAQQALQEVVLLPGSSRQLAVPLQGGPVGALLALGPEGTDSGSPAVPPPAPAGGGRGLAIVAPPLIAESAEQQWFGASGPQPAMQSPRGQPAPAVYIAPPGEATGLRLPLLGPGGQEMAAAVPAAGASSVAAAPPGGGAGGKGGAASGSSGPAAAAADCLLVTQRHADGLPCMQLTLLPAMVVHNCLPVPMLFQVPGAVAVEVPAGRSLPLAVAGSGVAAEAVVALRVPGGSGGSGDGTAAQQQLLQSQPFSLDCSEDGAAAGSTAAGVHLLLRPEAPAAPARNGSRGFWGGSSSSALDSSGSRVDAVECRLAARVEARSYTAVGGAAAEAISVAVTAGCFVSNLTGLPLAMLAEGAAASEATAATAAGIGGDQPSAAHPQQHALLPPAATVPLMHVWRSREEGSKQARHQRQRSWSSGDMLRTFSGGLLPSPVTAQPAAAGPGGPALRFALAAPLDPSEGDLPTPRTKLEQWPGTPAGAAAHAVPLSVWSTRLRPYDAAGRQRLYLQQPRGSQANGTAAPGGSAEAEGGGGLVMLTYRVLLSGGCFHLVLFRDRQPPFVVQNTTGGAIDVGFFPAAEALDGSVSYAAAPRSALRVGPGHMLECDFQPSRSRAASSSTAPSGGGSSGDEGTATDGPLSPVKRSAGGGATGGWDDQEDEDAFLDCLLREELRAAGQEQQRPPPVLKFRPAGGREWLHPCVLLPGLHAAAAATTPQAAGAAGAPARVHISRCCATTRILLLPPAGKPGAEAAGAAASAAQVAAEAEQPRPLRLDVSIRQLQLCLWDDERQRLLPPAGGGEAEAAGSVLGEELFCLSADQLYLHLSRQPQLEGPAGAAAAGAAGPPHAPPLHPWQRQPLLVSTAWLAAGGLQLDSFLPGSEQPVLLTSLPEGSFEGTGGGDSRRPGPPLQLGLVVHHCPAVPGGSSSPADPAADGSGGGGGMSFRNAWVHDLLVQLPTLAVAADDALLLFADRASALLLGGGGGDDYGSNGSGTGGSGEGSSPSPGSGQEGSALQAQQAQQVAGASLQEPAAPLAALQQSLAAEAAGAAASRLYIEQASVESVRLLLDAHITAGTAGVPVAVDTHRAPVTLSRIAAHDVLFRPHILVRGLMAHGVAEALLNAPQVLGSLSLLFNPTGLVRSVRAGVGDLIGLPLAALQNQSLSQFISGVGLGSVSLVKHTLGWTLTSISGFSQAFARAVDSAVAIRSTSAAGGSAGGTAGGAAALAHRPPPAHLGHGLSQGVASLAEGVAAGITGVVRAPIQGYSSGSGVLGGLARGLLGAVGLPVSGALELVGAVSAGLASSAGVVYVPQPRRDGRTLALAPAEAATEVAVAAAAGSSAHAADPPPPPAVISAARLMQHPALLAHTLDGASRGLGRYLAHTPLAAAAILQGAEGLRAAHIAAGFALQQPVLLVTDAAVVLFSSGGLEAVLVLPLTHTEAEVRYSSQEIGLFSRQAAPAGQPSAAAPAAVLCRLSREAWLRMAPLVRRRTAGARG